MDFPVNPMFAGKRQRRRNRTRSSQLLKQGSMVSRPAQLLQKDTAA